MNKGYYAVIPANVRYNKDLTANAKLLYGEITALANDKGYCWASNAYFSELYEVSKETISRWISKLEKLGYVKVQIIYKENTKEIIERRIYINGIPQIVNEKTYVQSDKNINTSCEKCQDTIDENINTPIDENVKDNNTVINNTFNNIYKDRQTNNISNTICKENDMSVNKNKIYEKVDDLLNGVVGSKDIFKIQKLLEDGYSDELLCYTLDLAKESKRDCNNSEIYRYLIGIWNNLKINNIKTLSDFKENEKQREVKRYESNRFRNAITVRTGENKENKYAYLDSI